MAGDKTPLFLTKALYGSYWSASRPGPFIPGQQAPGAHWIGDWLDLRAAVPADSSAVSP
jgi:hypothetical protein